MIHVTRELVNAPMDVCHIGKWTSATVSFLKLLSWIWNILTYHNQQLQHLKIVLIDFARSNIFTSKEVCVLLFRFLFLSKLISHIQKYTLNYNQPPPLHLRFISDSLVTFLITTKYWLFVPILCGVHISEPLWTISETTNVEKCIFVTISGSIFTK